MTGIGKKVGISLSTILSLVLSVLFATQLWNENLANRNYARVLKAVQKSVKDKDESVHASEYILDDLPERISVCPQYSPRGPVVFDPNSGLVRSNPVPDGRYKTRLNEDKPNKGSWRWDSALKTLMPLDLSDGKAVWPEKLNAESFAGRMEPFYTFYKNINMAAGNAELILDSNPKSAQGPVITIDTSEMSTNDGDYLALDALINAPTSLAAPRIEFYWRTRVHTNYEERDRFSYANVITNDGKYHLYNLSLRSNGWTCGGWPRTAAIGFPAGSHVQLRGVELIRLNKNALPQLTFAAQDIADQKARRFTPPYYDYPVDMQLGLLALPEHADALLADYSVADVPGATDASIELSYPNQSFNDANSNHFSGQMYKSISQKGVSGRIRIPVSDLPSTGVYSVRIIAKNARGIYLGQFSDALCFQVAKARKDN